MIVTFVIPLHNGLGFTRAMFASLEETLPNKLEYEVVFVDNASTDGTREWLAELESERVRVIRNETNAGYARANNQGAEAARGEWLCLLNNDLIFLPGWFEALWQVAETCPEAIVGSVLLSFRSREIDHAGIFFEPSGAPFHFRPPLAFIRPGEPVPVPAVTGACMLLRRQTFLDSGKFDEGYVNSYEDIDFCLRAAARGNPCLVARESVVYHYIGGTAGRQDAETRNAERFRERWSERLPSSQLLPPRIAPPKSASTNTHPDCSDYVILQVFHPDDSGLSENQSSLHLYRIDRWSRIRFPIYRGLSQGGVALRIDPCNFPAEIQVEALRLVEPATRKIPFAVRGAGLSRLLHPEGTVAEVSRPGVLAFLSTGNDPQLRIDPESVPESLLRRTDLAAEIWLRTSYLPPEIKETLIPETDTLSPWTQPGTAPPTATPPIRVAVDLTRLSRGGQNGGVKPFVFRMLRAISGVHPGRFVFTYFTRSSMLAEVEVVRRRTDRQVCIGESEGVPPPRSEGPVLRGLDIALDAPNNWTQRWPVDVLYAPLGFSTLTRPDLPWISLIVDTLHRDRPDLLPPEEVAFREKWFREVLADADAVQCNSEFVREQIVRHFGTPREKLFVTLNAVQDRVLRAAADAPPVDAIDRPYFFYPANDWPHKNHAALLDAFARYRKRAGSATWDLVLGGYFSRPEYWRERIAALGLQDLCRIPGFVGLREYSATFRNAGALIFPSLYEGFGIPVLEAMALGVPVACSRVGSLPEVAGDAARYFNPENTGAIAAALQEMTDTPKLRRELAAAGRKRAGSFSLYAEAEKLANRLVALARKERG